MSPTWGRTAFSAAVSQPAIRALVRHDSPTFTSELARHEDAVGILDVVGERPAGPETEPLVQAARRLEDRGRAGLEAEALIAAVARLGQHVVHQPCCHA